MLNAVPAPTELGEEFADEGGPAADVLLVNNEKDRENDVDVLEETLAGFGGALAPVLNGGGLVPSPKGAEVVAVSDEINVVELCPPNSPCPPGGACPFALVGILLPLQSDVVEVRPASLFADGNCVCVAAA